MCAIKKILLAAIAAFPLFFAPAADAQDSCVRFKKALAPTEYWGNCPEKAGEIVFYIPTKHRPEGPIHTWAVQPNGAKSFLAEVQTLGGGKVARCLARAPLFSLDDFAAPKFRLTLNCDIIPDEFVGEPIFQDGVWTVAWKGDRTDPAQVAAAVKRQP